MRTTIVILVAGVILAGCTAERYRRSADLQVNELLRDRQERTLGYTPQVEVETDIPARPPKHAFSKIPTTPIPPPTPSPLEPAWAEVDTDPLGPDWRADWPEVETLVQLQQFDITTQPVMLQLRLGPPAPDELIHRFDLFSALEYAVQNSRQYQAQMEDLYLAALNVTLERHLFGPRPFATTGVRYSGQGTGPDHRAALSTTATAGVRQQLPYGGEIVARTLVEFVSALTDNATDAESATVVISGSIPLLRGAGLVNLEPLINSERRLVYEVRRFEDFRRSFMVDIATRYFRLLTQQQGLINRQINYENLASLTERTQALHAAGRISFLEVQRSLQSLLDAENRLIVAQEQYLTALDNFKIVLGMPVEEPLEILPVELDLEMPQIELGEVVDLAIQYRLDLQTARDQIDDARRGVMIARNRLLPDLNLTGQTSIGNPPGTGAFDFDQSMLQYAAGLTLDLPIDRVAERNTLRRSMITFERAQRSYDEQRERVAVNARDALRAIRSAQISLEIQRTGIDLAQQRLDLANEVLRLGRPGADARNVVEAQSALLGAQDAFEQARANLQIQVLQFLRETGTLRVDPDAGSLGHALDRQPGSAVNAAASEW